MHVTTKEVITDKDQAKELRVEVGCHILTTVIEADGPFYFAGDTASHIVGWQEGAALSGKRAVGMIADRVKSARLAGASAGVAQG